MYVYVYVNSYVVVHVCVPVCVCVCVCTSVVCVFSAHQVYRLTGPSTPPGSSRAAESQLSGVP